MRRVIYSVAASLDGMIAGPDGEYDWIPEDPAIDFGAYLARFDTVLMGRRTYEVARQHGTAAMPGKTAFVFSRTLRADEHPGVEIVTDDAVRCVAGLREAPGRDIWLMGGGVLFRSLLDADLVDEVEVGVAPVLLGSGVPLCAALGRRTRLSLVHQQTYPSGIVMLRYAVKRDRS